MSSLKENADAFADCSLADDDQVSEARDERDDLPTQREGEAKVRDCLICRTPFPSAWAGERICRRCKSTSAWRGGALG